MTNPQHLLPHPTPPRPVLSIPEASEQLGVSRMTIYRLLQAGQLERLKIGRRAFIRRTELDRFLDEASTAYPDASHRVAPPLRTTHVQRRSLDTEVTT